MPSPIVQLPAVVERFVDAMNGFDIDALLATFAPDALVNDIQREICGRTAIAKFLEKEIVGDRVTMAITESRFHYGEVIVTALMDGRYDKTNLPPQLYLTFYFRIWDDRIVTLLILHNKPSPYAS